VPVLAALNSSENETLDVELAGVHVALVVAPQGLLVFGASLQCHVACLIELIDCVLERDLISFLDVGLYSQAIVVDVCGQHRFRAMHHEKGCESRGPTWCGA
jgi:hypothetical protein